MGKQTILGCPHLAESTRAANAVCSFSQLHTARGVFQIRVPAQAAHTCPTGKLLFSFKCPGNGISQDF